MQQPKMTEQRCVEIRRNPDPYPFQYGNDLQNLMDGIEIDDIVQFILINPEDNDANPDDFPKNIKEIFWMNQYDYYEQGLIMGGVLTNGSYFLFVEGITEDHDDGWSGNTPQLWITGSWANIINKAMDEEIYQQYLEETNLCILCKSTYATMGWTEKDCCADCFWERDAEEKAIRRSNPEWQTQRALSATKVLFDK